ncbi:MAG TPA: hypothetical protein VFQ74_06055 [Pseudolysinimonas sp.]|nr:hypothetical protein [Pseudolysinimonas sp.]
MIKRMTSALVALALGVALSLVGVTGAHAVVNDGGGGPFGGGGGGGGQTPPPAPANSESIDCSTAAVSLTHYDQAATATVVLDGVTKQSGTFNGSYTATWSLTSDAAHTSHQLQVTVVTTDSSYNVTYDQTVTGCYTAPPVVVSLPLTYETVVWSMPSPNSGHSATYPQVGVSQNKGETTETLDVAVPTTCGTQYQVDVYLQTNGTVDNTAAIDAMFAKGLAGPNGKQDGSYLAGQSGNPGVSGLNHAWKFVKNADCPTVVPCVVNTAIPWSPESDTGDLAPTVGPDGLEFNGPHTAAMDYYQRVTSGNMQGLTGMTVTYAPGGSGYQALVVVEVDPNVDLNATPGINHYATISSVLGAGDTSGTFNVQGALWYTNKIAYSSPGGQGHPITWAAMIALMPHNTLLSAPSLHQQTQTGADASSVVTSLSSSCGSTNFVPVKPGSIRSTTVTTGDPVCSITGGGTYDQVTHYWEQDSVWDAGTHSYSDPANATPYEYQSATTEVVKVGTDVCPTSLTPVDPTVVDQTCVVDDGGAGSYVSGYIDLPATVGVNYFIDGSPAGTHNELAPGVYHVTATASPNYTLTGYPDGGWSETIKTALACGDLVDHPIVIPIVTFTQLTCTADGSYTLSNDLGDPDAVLWTVDGSSVGQGTVQVTGARTVTVHAEPNGPDFGFADKQQRDWSFTFAAPGTCDLKTLALTGSDPSGPFVLAGFLILFGLTVVRRSALRRRTAQH